MSTAHRTRALVVAVGAAVLASAATATAAPSRTALQVADPVHVSGQSPLPPSCSLYSDGTPSPYAGSEAEVALTVDPRDPDVLAATWMQDAVAAHPVALSDDGGRTWDTTLPPALTACAGRASVAAVFDPWISYGGDGLLHLSSLSGAERSVVGDAQGTFDSFARHVYVQTSRDRGRSWGEATVAGGDVDNGFVLDKGTITADPVRAGHAYATWARIQLVVGTPVLGFARTTDGGRTWQEVPLPPVAVSDRGVLGGQVLSEVEVLPDGDLLLVTGDVVPQPQLLPAGLLGVAGVEPPVGPFLGPMRYLALRSSDAGRTWAPTSSYIGEGMSVPEAPTSAVAPDGTVYVGWMDRAAEGSSLVLARSDDGGRTWTRRTVVPRGDISVPAVAVDGRGEVGLTWYEADGDRLQPWAAVSTDRGERFTRAPLTPAFSTADAPQNHAAGAGPVVGDYEGLVGQRKGFVSVLAVTGALAADGPTDVVSVRFRSRG